MHISTFIHKCSSPYTRRIHGILNLRKLYIRKSRTFYCKHCGDLLSLSSKLFADFLTLLQIATWPRMSPLCIFPLKFGCRSFFRSYLTLINFRAWGSAFFSVGFRLFLWLFESAFYDKNRSQPRLLQFASSVAKIFFVLACLVWYFLKLVPKDRFPTSTF